MMAGVVVTYGDTYSPRVVYRVREEAEAGRQETEGKNLDGFVSALLRALKPFAEAREAVLQVLRERLGKAPPSS